MEQLNIKDETQRSRGRFKPVLNLTNADVKSVLMQKIAQETSKIIEDEADVALIKNIKLKQDKINVVSLFSGAGGLDLGVELAGLVASVGYDQAMQAFNLNKTAYDAIRQQSIFHTVYTNDMFLEANQTYRLNFNSDILQHQKDIREVACFPDNELMVGGFPCPGFSEAGPRLIDDDRNFLYLHFIRALVQTQPAFFVAENVKGMMTLGNGEVIKQIIEDFASAGYTVTPHLVNARDYGIPQSRERVFLVGVHKEKIEAKYGFHYRLPAPTHGNFKQPFVTLRDSIGDLVNDCGDVFEGSYSTMYMSRNRKRLWNEQSFTIQASGRQAPQHPGGQPMIQIGKNQWSFSGEHRRLSVKEIQRIQTFPDWFKFSYGSKFGKSGKEISHNARIDRVYRQIGNAVPVLLARAIIQPIADFTHENM